MGLTVRRKRALLHETKAYLVMDDIRLELTPDAAEPVNHLGSPPW